MQVSDALSARLAKRRKRVVLLAVALAIPALGVIAFLLWDFGIERLLTALTVIAALFVIFLITLRKRGLRGAYAPPVCGRVTEKRMRAHGGQTALYRELPEYTAGTLVVHAEDGVREYDCEEALLALYEVGDEVLVADAFVAPLVLSRVPARIACPLCGTSFPTADSRICPACRLDTADVLAKEER